MNSSYNMKDVTSSFSSKDIQDNRFMALLSYLSILVIIPVVAARGSRYAMFHANQGIALAACEIVFGMAVSLVGWVPLLGLVAKLVAGIVGLACLGLSILGIVNTLGGKAVKFPIIGSITIFSAE